jgi:hypothetical protein
VSPAVFLCPPERSGNGQLVLVPDHDVRRVLSEDGELALVVAIPDQFTDR